MTRSLSPFRSARGEARYMAAYEKTMRLWPIPYDPIDVVGTYGRTHLNMSGPPGSPPLLLVHASFCSSTMWAPNIADLSEHHRVYAVDVIDQGGKSVPAQLMKNRLGCAAWMTEVLDALDLPKVTLVAMSYGCWLCTNFAILNQDRVDRLVLLSPGDTFVPTVPQFYLRGLPSMALPFLPERVLRHLFMDWLTYSDNLRDPATREMFDLVTEQMHKLFRSWRLKYTLDVATQGRPKAFPDNELRAMQVPTLLMIGEEEVVVDRRASMERAKRLIPNFAGELVPRASHDMPFSRYELVDQRIIEFLEDAGE